MTGRGLTHAITAALAAAVACSSFGAANDGDEPTRGPDAGVAGIDAGDSAVDEPADAASLGCPTGASLCDDFESPTLDRWLARAEQSSGGVALAAVEGNHVMRAHLDASSLAGSAFGGVRLDIPLSGTVAVRARVFPSRPLPIDTTLLELRGATSAAQAVSFTHRLTLPRNEKWRLEARVNGGLESYDQQFGVRVVVGVWSCMELVVRFGEGTAGRLAYFVDGKLAAPAVNVATLGPVTPLETELALFAGAASSNAANTSTDVLIDDVAVTWSADTGGDDVPRIGCR